jgi:hypothetical protein
MYYYITCKEIIRFYFNLLIIPKPTIKLKIAHLYNYIILIAVSSANRIPYATLLPYTYTSRLNIETIFLVGPEASRENVSNSTKVCILI